jgi:CHASE2 domain-containing sensor protein
VGRDPRSTSGQAARRRSTLTWTVLVAAFFGCCFVPLLAGLVESGNPAVLGLLGALVGLAGVLGGRRAVARRRQKRSAVSPLGPETRG